MKLALVAAAVFILNLPFGYWRAGLRKFSWQWIVSIHAAVPAVVALRLASGLGFQFVTFPVMIGSYFLGQVCGGRAHRYRNGDAASQPEGE